MTMATLKALDTIANLKPISGDRLILVEPVYRSIQQLFIGQVGTILEIYPGDPLCYLVEFADSQGREYAMVILQADEMLGLHSFSLLRT
jgi:hypothetical protein